MQKCSKIDMTCVKESDPLTALNMNMLTGIIASSNMFNTRVRITHTENDPDLEAAVLVLSPPLPLSLPLLLFPPPLPPFPVLVNMIRRLMHKKQR